MATVITLFPYKSININGTYQYFKEHTLGTLRVYFHGILRQRVAADLVL